MSRARRIGVGVVGLLGVGAVIAATLSLKGGSEGPPKAASQDPPAARPAGSGDLADRLRSGSASALTELTDRLTPPAVEAEGGTEPWPPAPLTDAEADEFLGLVAALSDGITTYNGPAKVVALNATGRIFERFAVDGAPAGWSGVLEPSFKVIATGLSDRDPSVRIAAADLVAGLWVWSPGRQMIEAEEKNLAAWKEGFYAPIVRGLQDAEPLCRAAAVRCLGRLPIDDKAAPAVAAIRDPDFNVRYQALVSLGNRPNLLTADQILPMLHDPIRDLGGLAERVLKARGLSQELVGLGRLISHARPDMRTSAIPLLLKRDDIDPVVWLLRLTEDPDASVRLKAVEALEGRTTAEVQRRLRELAEADESADVRSAAARLAPASGDRTVALPPLPGAPGLNLRAN